jgi:hypothetical protein
MRTVLAYLSILAAALAGGVYFARALIDPAVYALAALPSAPSVDVPARFAKSPPPAPEPAPSTPPAPAVERTVVVAPPALAERPVESARTRALRKAKEASKQSAKRKPRRSSSEVAASPSQDAMSFAPSPSFGPFRSASDSW